MIRLPVGWAAWHGVTVSDWSVKPRALVQIMESELQQLSVFYARCTISLCWRVAGGGECTCELVSVEKIVLPDLAAPPKAKTSGQKCILEEGERSGKNGSVKCG